MRILARPDEYQILSYVLKRRNRLGANLRPIEVAFPFGLSLVHHRSPQSACARSALKETILHRNFAPQKRKAIKGRFLCEDLELRTTRARDVYFVRNTAAPGTGRALIDLCARPACNERRIFQFVLPVNKPKRVHAQKSISRKIELVISILRLAESLAVGQKHGNKEGSIATQSKQIGTLHCVIRT
jgi:hypothetical protein